MPRVMSKHSEDELLDSLTRLVAMWKTTQRNDGKSRPLVGCLPIHDLDAETYMVNGISSSPARLPTRPTLYPMSVIEDLIRLGYLHPMDGPRRVTYLQPTTDALFLTDVSTRETYLVTFHQRYERLRSTRA